MRQRTVIVLRFVADLTEAEIARTMSVSRTTAASALADGRRNLARLLEDHPSVTGARDGRFPGADQQLVHHPALVPTAVEELAARSQRRRARRRPLVAAGAAILLVVGTVVALVVPLPQVRTGQPVNAGTPGWSPIAVAPVQGHWEETAPWTGREMIVLGGGRATGAAYDPSTNTWRVIAPTPLGALGSEEAIWSGSRMIIVGAAVNGQFGAASHDPVANAWAVPPAPPMGSVSPNSRTGVCHPSPLLMWKGR